jgi:hypothetical protein
LERRTLILENRALQRRLDELTGAGELIGQSPAIRDVLDLVRQVAPTAATVLTRARAAPARSWSPGPFTTSRTGAGSPSSA